MKKNNIKHLTTTICAEVVARINRDEGEYADSVRGDFDDDMAKRINSVERFTCAYKWYKHIKGVKAQ